MQSLLSAVLVILIILLLAVVFVPAWLERTARANQARRGAGLAEWNDLHRDIRRFERSLHVYARANSAAYRDALAAAGERLKALSDQMEDAGATLDGLRCPEVYDYLLPAQHFVINPSDAGTILADSRRLRQARRELDAATAIAAETSAALESLAGLAERLAADRANLGRRLAELEAATQRERLEGIVALDDFVRVAAQARDLLEKWDRIARPDAPVAELDEGAIALESAAAILAEGEARAAELAGERAALDQRIRRAAAELDNAQVSSKTGQSAADAPNQVRPLLRRAAVLLNESAIDHRSRREFNAAGGDVAAAIRLTGLARDLATAHRDAAKLVARDDGAGMGGPGMHAAIAGLRNEVAELLDRLGEEALSDDGLATLAGRAAQARSRAETLARQQDEVIADLEREAMTTRERLERSWESGRRLLPLAGDDPLSRRHDRLLEDFQAAQRRPAALEKFRVDVTAFEGVLASWVTRVQATRARVGRLRQRLPELIDAMLAAAAPWKCLNESVVFIQQRAADFETAQARFAAARYRRETETLMDQIEAIENDIEERAAQLNDWAARLRFLEDDVRQIIDLAGADVAAFPADHPDRVRWDKALKLIDHHTRSAHAALRYEDASVSLLRAADVANKLAL